MSPLATGLPSPASKCTVAAASAGPSRRKSFSGRKHLEAREHEVQEAPPLGDAAGES